jgi:hypothetical protein
VRQCAAVCGSGWQCAQQRVAVRTVVCVQCMRQCAAVRLVLDGSARGSVRQFAAVRRCAAVWKCAAGRQCAAEYFARALLREMVG